MSSSLPGRAQLQPAPIPSAAFPPQRPSTTAPATRHQRMTRVRICEWNDGIWNGVTDRWALEWVLCELATVPRAYFKPSLVPSRRRFFQCILACPFARSSRLLLQPPLEQDLRQLFLLFHHSTTATGLAKIYRHTHQVSLGSRTNNRECTTKCIHHLNTGTSFIWSCNVTYLRPPNHPSLRL